MAKLTRRDSDEKITENVRDLLKNFPSLRDHDWELHNYYYYKYCAKKMGYDEFLKKQYPQSISDTRRILQRKNEELRWKTWTIRHKVYEPEEIRKIRQRERHEELLNIYGEWKPEEVNIPKQKTFRNLFWLLW